MFRRTVTLILCRFGRHGEQLVERSVKAERRTYGTRVVRVQRTWCGACGRTLDVNPGEWRPQWWKERREGRLRRRAKRWVRGLFRRRS